MKKQLLLCASAVLLLGACNTQEAKVPTITVANTKIALTNAAYANYDIDVTISDLGNYLPTFTCEGVVKSASLDTDGNVFVTIDENISQYERTGKLTITLNDEGKESITASIDFTQEETTYILSEHAEYSDNDKLTSKEVYEFENGELKYTYLYELLPFATEAKLSIRESTYIDKETGERVTLMESPTDVEGVWVNNSKHVITILENTDSVYSEKEINYSYSRDTETWTPMTGTKRTTDKVSMEYTEETYSYISGEEQISSRAISRKIENGEETLFYNSFGGELKLYSKEENYIEDDVMYFNLYLYNNDEFTFSYGTKLIYEDESIEGMSLLTGTTYRKDGEEDYKIDLVEKFYYGSDNELREEINDFYSNGDYLSSRRSSYTYDDRDLLVRIDSYESQGEGEEQLDEYETFSYIKA